MTRIGPAGVGIAALVAVALVAGGAAVGLPAEDRGPPDRADIDRASPGGQVAVSTADALQSAPGEGEVGLELRPMTGSADPGENATYDVVITGADTGVSAYGFNVSVGNTSIAEITGFSLDRAGFFDDSFISSDNSTVAFDVSLGSDEYAAATEIRVATVTLTATGRLGDSTPVSFDYDPNESVFDNDDVFYTVAEDQSATLNVGSLPEFRVSNLDPTDLSVAAGETLNVSADVENVGSPGAQTLTLAVDGYSENTTLSLAADASERVTFQGVDTGALGPGEYTHSVSSENDTVSGTLTVLAPAEFAVAVQDVTAPVEGDNLTVTAGVENTGDVGATQTVELDVPGLGSNSTSVTLGGGNATQTTLSVETGAGDAGEYTATLTSANSTATAPVSVDAPAFFDVTVTSINKTVPPGETVTVGYEVTNTGDVAATQNVTFAVNGTTEDTEPDVTLDGNGTREGTFGYTTGTGDSPAVTLTVATEDDSVTETATVPEPAFFGVTLGPVNQTVVAGETVTVGYEVTNTGDIAATQAISLSVNGTVEETNSGVTLAGGDTLDDEFTYQTEPDDPPGVAVAVESGNDSAGETVSVVAPAFLEVSIAGVDDPVAAGETVTIGYEVTNTGGVEATQNLTLAVDGSAETVRESVTVGGGDTVSDEFAYETVAGDTPGVTVTVASGDDTASTNVTVLAPPAFAVDIVETNAPLVAGDDLVVTVEVANVGGAAGEQSVQVDAGSVGSTDRTVSLAGGGSVEETFSLPSTTEQTGTYELFVDVGGDTAGTTVELTPTPLPGASNPPQDVDGDGRYENVDGDNEFGIFDVQAFFNSFDSEVVRQHTPAFDFNDDGEVSIFDVQELFNELAD